MRRWLSIPHAFHTAVLSFLVFGVALGAPQNSQTLEQSFQIQPGGSVEVNNPSGGVQIHIWDEDYVHVRAEKITPEGEPVFFSDITFAASDTTIVIGCYPVDARSRINLTVYAPRHCQVLTGMGQRPVQDQRQLQSSKPQPAYPPDAGQQLPPPRSGSSVRIAGDTGRGAGQQSDGPGPFSKTADRKNADEGSMGMGVRVIPPFETSPNASGNRRSASSDQDPFAVFDEDEFFKDDRGLGTSSSRSSRRNSDMGWPGSTTTRSDSERSRPVLRPRDQAAGAGPGTDTYETDGRSSNGPNDDVLVLQGEMVILNVSARDRSGKAVSGLTQSSFQVYEDEVVQQVAFFSPSSAPFNLVLVLDLSGSMREKVNVLKGAAIRFIDTLNPQDRVAVVTFTHQARLISELTQDRTLLRERIQQMESDKGRTALYEALWQVVTEVLAGTEGQRNAIVLLSDGVDNSISEFNTVPTVIGFDELLTRIEEADVILYPIYLDTEREVVYKYLQESPETYRLARDRLSSLADLTGGVMYQARRLDDLDNTYDQVAAELRTIYTLAYYPTNIRRDGNWRKIRVKVKGKNVAVRTRAGYYAR